MEKRFTRQLPRTANEVVVTSNVMKTLFFTFKESIEAVQKDKLAMIEKLNLFNSIAEAFSDYLKEFTDAMAAIDSDKDSKECRESWRSILIKQKQDLATLVEAAESYRETTAKLLKQLD